MFFEGPFFRDGQIRIRLLEGSDIDRNTLNPDPQLYFAQFEPAKMLLFISPIDPQPYILQKSSKANIHEENEGYAILVQLRRQK